MGFNGITEHYIVMSIENEVERPVYVYEFSANDSNDLRNATEYEDLETAEQATSILNQMQQLQGGDRVFETRKVTTKVEGVDK